MISFPKLFLFLFCLAALSNICLCNEVSFYPGSAARFVSLEEGQQIITYRDQYINSLSPYDMQSRCWSLTPVTEQEYLDRISSQVRSWNQSEIRSISRILIREIAQRLEPYPLHFPDIINLVKTTGSEEGYAYYTRQHSIFIPHGSIDRDILLHELFHILSRHDSEFRQRMYQIIGFYPCNNEIKLPATLSDIKITNPDAPTIDYYITISYQGVRYQTVPILFAAGEYTGEVFFSIFRLWTDGYREHKWNPSTYSSRQSSFDFQIQ